VPKRLSQPKVAIRVHGQRDVRSRGRGKVGDEALAAVGPDAAVQVAHQDVHRPTGQALQVDGGKWGGVPPMPRAFIQQIG
jgi:hypothetical protein